MKRDLFKLSQMLRAGIMWYLVVQSLDNGNDWLLVARLLFHSLIGHFDWNSIKNKRSWLPVLCLGLCWFAGTEKAHKNMLFILSSSSSSSLLSLFHTNWITGASSPSLIRLMVWISLNACWDTTVICDDAKT